MLKRQNSNKIKEIKEEIKSVYLNDDKPWILGYSGGKDSTVVLQLVVEVLFELKKDNLAHKKIYVISSDTLVENPLVIEKTKRSMDNINSYAKESQIPLEAVMIYPEFDNTFFVNLIGKGYPAPLQSFRWCTDRIKIQPANKFIKDKVDENGEVILLLGTRFEESASRARSMQKHEIEGSILSLHSSIENAWTYPVIRNLKVTDVWGYLLKNKCPWGDDNTELYNMYSQSNMDGECPLVIDSETKDAGNCGNSRFGCWTCTVVAKDKSLTGFINSGEKWLQPFLDYHDTLVRNRDQVERRNLFDKRGNLKLVEVSLKNNPKENNELQIHIAKKMDREEEYISLDKVITYEEALEVIKKEPTNALKTIVIKKNEKYYRIGRSGYSFDERVRMLKELFEVQNKVRKVISNYEIIKVQEIMQIDQQWKSSGYIKESAIKIYNDYNANKLDVAISNIDYVLLEQLCMKNSFDYENIIKIINNIKSTKNLKNRNRSIKVIEKILSEHKLMIKGNNEN